MSVTQKLEEARDILRTLGLERQTNDRSAFVLLALLDLRPTSKWMNAAAPRLGIAAMIAWVGEHYAKTYKTGSRETIRKETLHQLMAAGVALYNPDDPNRPVNSPKAVYQIAPRFAVAARSYGTKAWEREIGAFIEGQKRLAQRYAKERAQRLVPVVLSNGQTISLSGGEHSQLIRDVVEDFSARYIGGGHLVYVGDTGSRHTHIDEGLLAKLGVTLDKHGKMPDVIVHDPQRNWLFLIEAVSSHGPVDAKRHDELTALFQDSTAGLVYVTAFQTRSMMAKYLSVIAWETEVWVADAPNHLIHFNGDRFLGPHT